VYLYLLSFVLFVLCFLHCFFYVYVFLLVLFVFPLSDKSIVVNNNNNNNDNNTKQTNHCTRSKTNFLSNTLIVLLLIYILILFSQLLGMSIECFTHGSDKKMQYVFPPPTQAHIAVVCYVLFWKHRLPTYIFLMEFPVLFVCFIFLTWNSFLKISFLDFLFCWPCISIYVCNETNLMHYLSLVTQSLNLYMFRAC
jgi:hypothetical protein